MTDANRLLDDVLALKSTRRSGWTRLGVEVAESVAEHSFSAAVISWILARRDSSLNAERVLAMALLHDLHESRMGDIPHPVKAEAGCDEEIVALEASLSRKQWEGDEEALDLMREYHEGSTPEARLVQAVDHLELILQARRFSRRGLAGLGEFLDSDGPALYHPLTRDLAAQAKSDT